MQDKISKRANINIELMRIICAILVISTHVFNRNYVMGGEIRNNVCFLNSFCIVAVPCFLMTTGYYARKGQSWLKKIKKTISSIVLPALLISFIISMIFPWICHTMTLRESIASINFKEIIQALLLWKIEKLPGNSHLWYIVAYCHLTLIFPLLSYLCCNDKNARLARRMLYALYAFAICYKDLLQIFPNMISLHYYNLIDCYILYFLLGYEFNEIKLDRSNMLLMGGLMTLFGCLMMYVMTHLILFETGTFSDFFFHYQTIPCMIASFGAFAFFLALSLQHLPEKVVSIIQFLGRQTWLVYLIHVLPLNFIRTIPNKDVSSLGSLLLLILEVTVISFTIAIIINELKKCLYRLLSLKQP